MTLPQGPDATSNDPVVFDLRTSGADVRSTARCIIRAAAATGSLLLAEGGRYGPHTPCFHQPRTRSVSARGRAAGERGAAGSRRAVESRRGARALALTEHIETYGTTAITLPWDHGDGPHKTFHLLFTNTKGRAIRRDHFNESAWHRALRACGITPAGKSTGIHQLRHHVASLLLAHGMSIAEVAEVLGDTVQEVSETYAHAMPDFSKRLRSINTARGARIATAREDSGTDQ